jgi:3-dehydroquinate synthetase
LSLTFAVTNALYGPDRLLDEPSLADEADFSTRVPAPLTTSSLDFGHDGVIRVSIERRLSYAVMRARVPVFSPQSLLISDVLRGRSVFFVIDSAVDALYGGALRSYAAKRLHCTGDITISHLEASKSLATVETICVAAGQSGLPRDGVILGFGGGVTLDQAGLAASLYRRGVPFVRVPTTLVGMVDVGVGIKQGVNCDQNKNLLGAFYPAFANIIDLSFLGSLPARAIASGVAEIAKMAIICDRGLFQLLECYGAPLVRNNYPSTDLAEEIVTRAQITMMNELCDDLYEEDRARVVDLGHTFSTLIEPRSGFALSHGEAVALDIVFSAAISAELGLCHPALIGRIVHLFRSVGLPVTHDALDSDLALDAIAKARAHRGKLNLVVPREIGSVMFLQDVGKPALDGALSRMRACD